jgi:alpha-glucoside transport system permease protein
MSTPPILRDESEEAPPPLSAPPEIRGGPLVWAGRVVSALVVPAVVIFVFFFAFDYLRDEDANKVLQVLLAVLVGSLGVWALYWSMDRLVGLLPQRAGEAIRPFVYVGPAMALLTFYLVYPAVNTTIISFKNDNSSEWVGFENFATVFTQEKYLISMRNSVIWVMLVPLAAVAIGLAFATMADKLGRRSESVAKSIIFLPMAISFVGASVVWGFIYFFRTEGFGEQIGLLNAIRASFDAEAINWLILQPWNNLFLMVILVWLQTGFAMVIISSAIKGVPVDMIEAARIDGASEWQVFRSVVFPTISPTVVVVWTTILITVWKVFDIVWVTTGGRDNTQVVAQSMVDEFFTNFNYGTGATLAVLLFIAVIPILIINVRRFREQEAIR